MKNTDSYLINQIIVNAILNFCIAYFIPKHALKALNYIPFKAPENDPFHPNMAGDLLVGTFIMGVVLTFILTCITRFKSFPAKANNLEISPYWLAYLPAQLIIRALFIGLLASLFLAFPVVAIMDMLSIMSLSVETYIIGHAVYCTLASIILTIIVCKRAFLDKPRHSNVSVLE